MIPDDRPTFLAINQLHKLNVRATAVGWDAERDAERNMVLAGDSKCLVYYVISKLTITYLAGDPKRKG